MIYVYLNDEYIKIVDAEKHGSGFFVKNVYFSEGTKQYFVNGEIIDADGFSAFIAEFWKTNRIFGKHILLTLHSPFIMSRTVEVPAMSKRRTEVYIQAQFKEIERIQNPVVSYYIVSENREKGTRTSMASVTDAEFVKKIVSVFSNAGVKIDAFNDALACVAKMLMRVKKFKNASCIVLVPNGSTVTSILLSDGAFVYSNDALVTDDHLTPEYGYQIAKTVSQIRQFARSNNMRLTVNDVYITEPDKNSFDLIDQSISQLDPEITVSDLVPLMDIVLPKNAPEINIGDYLYALSASTTDYGRSEIIHKYKYNSDKKRKNREIVVQASIAVGLAFILSIVCLFLGVENSEKEAELDKYNKRLENVGYIKQENDYIKATENIEILSDTFGMVDTVVSNIKSYPDADSSVGKVIDECASGLAEAVIVGYSSDTGLVTINATAASEAPINKFIANLMIKPQFAKIDYTGYEYQDKTNRWKVNVLCYLSSDKSKEEQVN